MTTTTDLDRFRRDARAWIEANLEPRRPDSRPRGLEYRSPEEIDRNRRIQRLVYDGGYAGISFPAEFGGRGLTMEHERAFQQEARGFQTPDLGGAGMVTYGPIARSIMAHATPQFCRRHIPSILSGESIWCQFYSEPEAGSDLAGIRTTATRDGDRWLISGSKIWSTGAYYADWAMCLARTNWDAPKHRGLTWFAIPTHAPGLTIRPVVQINGTAGFCEEFLDAVSVSDDDVIGEIHQGWSVAQTMLVYERGVGEASAKTAEPRKLAPDLVDLARGAGRLEDPLARQQIARAHINEFAQYQLGRRIAARFRSSGADPAVAAYGKLAAGTLLPIRTRIALELGGSAALTWRGEEKSADGPALDYLDGRMGSIAGGTNEMQRNGIGERVLGLPREPSFDSNKPFSEVIRAAQNWSGRVG